MGYFQALEVDVHPPNGSRVGGSLFLGLHALGPGSADLSINHSTLSTQVPWYVREGFTKTF